MEIYSITDFSNYLIILIATMNLSCSHSIMSKTFRTHVNKTQWRKPKLKPVKTIFFCPYPHNIKTSGKKIVQTSIYNLLDVYPKTTPHPQIILHHDRTDYRKKPPKAL